MAKSWNVEELNELMRGYQGACVLLAAAELEVLPLLAAGPLSAEQVAGRIGGDRRATRTLLDALAALELLIKSGPGYALAPGLADLATPQGRQTQLAMMQHQANCLRRWARLAEVVKTGRPADAGPSVRGVEGDRQSFIEAMNNVSGPAADAVVADLRNVPFTRVLDVGGASGTWTLAFLRLNPKATAILFDLPHVIPMARQRLVDARAAARVTLVAGDFTTDELPPGADLAWVSAIIHSQSRAENQALYAKVARALVAGGRILIRDLVMDASRTQPAAGALFAINMLVGTATGGTFTFEEIRQDLEAAGFGGVTLVRQDSGMNAVVGATKAR